MGSYDIYTANAVISGGVTPALERSERPYQATRKLPHFVRDDTDLRDDDRNRTTLKVPFGVQRDEAARQDIRQENQQVEGCKATAGPT